MQDIMGGALCALLSFFSYRRTFERFSRGNSMRYTPRPAISSSYSPIPTLAYFAGGSLSRARVASRRGLLLSFFTPKTVFDPTP